MYSELRLFKLHLDNELELRHPKILSGMEDLTPAAKENFIRDYIESTFLTFLADAIEDRTVINKMREMLDIRLQNLDNSLTV